MSSEYVSNLGEYLGEFGLLKLADEETASAGAKAHNEKIARRNARAQKTKEREAAPPSSLEAAVDAKLESGKSADRRLLDTPKIAADKAYHDAEHYEPRPDENPVIAALRKSELYGHPIGDGKHDIACAFTGDAMMRAVYYEPTPSHPRGGYFCKCKICHRKHRIGDLLTHLGIGKAEAMHKPTFRAVGGELHAIVNQAEKELAQSRLFFQQGGMIVKVITDEHGVTKVCAVNKVALNYEFNGRFTWQKFDKRSSEWFVIDAPTAYAHTLFDLMNYEHLPPILSVARQPFFRDDNTLCAHSGYDEASRIYAIFDETAFRVAAAPSPAVVETAKSSLLSLLDGFEFAAETDRAAAFCALLTAAVRATLHTAPGILATAHSPGSGKSYLLDMAALFASDQTAAAASFLIDDDEMRKQLIAALIESPAAIKFDEMKSDLVPLKTLLSCLSAEQIEGRILGASKIVRPSTRSLMLFAGNNVQAVQDMCRRILTIHLDVQCESPATRAFSDDPLSRLKANRATYVSHALTLIAWAQKEDVTLTKRLNGFGRWEQLCRRTVIALGLPDPCANIFAQLDHDPDREQLAAVLDAIHAARGSYAFKVRDLVDQAPAGSDLYDLLAEVSHSKGDGIDKQQLARWFKRNVGKVANGKRFEQDNRFKSNVVKFRVLTLSDLAPAKPDYPDCPDSFAGSGEKQSRVSRDNRDIPAPTPEVSEGEI